jgi:hypothetical protein
LAPAPIWLLDLLRLPFSSRMMPPDGPSIDTKAGGNHSQPVSGVIAEGARNATLTSLAGAMRRKGCGEAAIVAALRVENTERCRPPLAESEIATIAHSVCRYAPDPGSATPGRSMRGSRRFVEFVDGKAVAR